MRRSWIEAIVRTGAVALTAALVVTCGLVGTSAAFTGELQIIVSGALGIPLAATNDAEITLAIGAGLPVSMVSGGVSTWPATVGQATIAQWVDASPSPSFGQLASLMVFRLGGGFTVMAGGIQVKVPGPFGVLPRFESTFSATSPVETLSGSWSMEAATVAGVGNAGPFDAVVKFEFDTNPANTIHGTVDFVARNLATSVVNKTIPGLATVGVAQNVPVLGLSGSTIGPQMGTLTSYSAFNLAGPVADSVELTAIDFGGPVLIYGCTPGGGGPEVCLAGGSALISNLSGNITKLSRLAGIPGLTDADVVLRLNGSLP